MKKIIPLLIFVFLFLFLLPQSSISFAEEELCCPPGFGTSRVFDCGNHPFPLNLDIDTSKFCCKRGTLQLEEKIPCSNISATQPNACNIMGSEGIETALGCIPTKPATFVKYLLNFAIGIGGGIAFLLMIFGGLQIIFSGGNPDKVKAGKEMITGALAGLLLIIFSVFILRIIGYDILRLPGFNK